MLMQIKVYWIGCMYFLGALFMFVFPPRNFDLSGSKIRTRRSNGDNLKFSQYVDYTILRSTAEEIAHNDPEVVNVSSLLPLTAENRSILAVELRSDKWTRKPGILIIGGINEEHSDTFLLLRVQELLIRKRGLDAMAWGAPNALLELSHKLLYDANYQTPFFNDYDWYLIPMANPDGIMFTQNIRSRPPVEPHQWANNDTLRPVTRPVEWHKNMEDAGKTPCFGTNINRNFAYHWQDDVHKTPIRCCQYYPGTKPFSAAETMAIREYVDNLGAYISLAIHLHVSFVPKKEYILYPWRYSLRQPSNFRTLQEIGEYAARKARLPDGRLYEVHQSSSDERVAGTISDYVSGVVGIDLVFLLKPYHQMFPNFTDTNTLGVYVKKSMSTILSVVRGWRSSTNQNTLHFFGKEIEF